MKTHDVQKAAWWGAFSNYGRVVLQMVLGLVTFRLLYQGLDAESFGFWSLLWSVFGYGILLDFGFGSAAQKRVSDALSPAAAYLRWARCVEQSASART